MSKIGELGENFKNLPDILSAYEDELLTYEDNLTTQGKTLEKCLKEQATWSAYYNERAIELKSIKRFLESQVAKVRSLLFRQYSENSSRLLADRVIEKYIDHESEYLTIYELFLEIQELHEKFEGVVDAFRTRGFALNNLTNAKIHEVQSDTL